MKSYIGKVKIPRLRILLTMFLAVLLLVMAVGGGFWGYRYISSERQKLESVSGELTVTKEQLSLKNSEYEELANQDQIKKNQELAEEIKNIQETYKKSVSTYEEIVKLRELTNNTGNLEIEYTKALTTLAERNYGVAGEAFDKISKDIGDQKNKLAEAAQVATPEPAPAIVEPPSSGYRRQQVNTSIGTYTVSIVSGELGSTRVIVDTASPGDCANDCPVLALGDYVSRNGAYAGVNGSYFCPASYPSCAGKTNSFDTLLMNKDKVYFNSGNNVYSNVPAVIFGGGYIRFVSASSQWGRDSGIDSMIANQPLLVSGGQSVFAGDSDPKKGSKAGRSFVANKGNAIYIGVVHNATVAEAATVLATMGMENALNLDSGGSTALWSGGYKVGPGRAIPNAILFVRK